MLVVWTSELDLVLMEQRWSHKIVDVYSCREVPLSSHHFLLLCHLEAEVPKDEMRAGAKKRKDIGQLRSPKAAKNFSERVLDHLQPGCTERLVEEDLVHV